MKDEQLMMGDDVKSTTTDNLAEDPANLLIIQAKNTLH